MPESFGYAKVPKDSSHQLKRQVETRKVNTDPIYPLVGL